MSFQTVKRYFETIAFRPTGDCAYKIQCDRCGVCPFAVNSDAAVYLGVSRKRFERVYPGGGNGHSAVNLSLKELAEYADYTGWVDVCKDWIQNDCEEMKHGIQAICC